MSEAPLLRIEHLCKQFAGIPALRDANLQLLPGEVHALVGENGAGKSTLINILSGLLRPDSGRIFFDGVETATRSADLARTRGISVIYQDFDLAPNLSIADNILLGQEPQRGWGFIDRRESRKRASEALARVGLAVDPATRVSRLTTAQRQLVAISRAISRDTRLLVMDEPTSALAAHDTDHLLELMLELKNSGMTILFISHKLDEIFHIADRITVLRDGQTVACREVAGTSRQEIITLMVGRELKDLFFKQAKCRDELLLEVRALQRQGVFEDISFTLRSGEVLGFYGLKGAGRSELANALFGLITVDGGEIRLHGQRADIRSCPDAIRHGIGMVPEDRKALGLFPNLDVQENLSIAELDNVSIAGFIQPRKERASARQFISELNIRTSGPQQAIPNLSGGNQQKVLLARWLAVKPRVLILDEPTAGIDVGAKAEIYRLIGELTGQGVGIILISSELPEVLGLSDRVLVMHAGRIKAEFAAADVSEEKVMQAIHA